MSELTKYTSIASAGLLLAIGWHFGTVLGLFGSAPQTPEAFFWRIGSFTLAFIVAVIVISIWRSLVDEVELEADEREQKVIDKSEKIAGVVLAIGVVNLVWLAFQPLTPMQTANFALASLCLAEMARLISAAIFTSRGV